MNSRRAVLPDYVDMPDITTLETSSSSGSGNLVEVKFSLEMVLSYGL